MKIQHIILLLLLVGCCAVSAQTTNAFSKTNTPSLLTKEQAQSLALRLANEKIIRTNEEKSAVFGTNDSIVIVVGTNSTTFPGTQIQTRFADGHWISTFDKVNLQAIYSATVELAPDGSTNAVSAEEKRLNGIRWP